MADTQDFPWSPLSRDALDQVMASGSLRKIDLELLRWLVWLSLLSVRELTRLVKIDGHSFDAKTIGHHLLHLEHLDLVASITLSEAGWPPNLSRYYITDLGLYALVQHYSASISVPKLLACYPVTRTDLLARLARPVVHLALSELVSRLIAESPQGYTLSSYQQPWKQAYGRINGGGQQVWKCDAAFLLQTPMGTQHAFYTKVDQPECLFSQAEAKRWLSRLFALRTYQRLHGEVMPHLLLLSTPERFPFWAQQIERATLLVHTSLPTGCIADYTKLASGAYARIWLPFGELVSIGGRDLKGGQTSLLSLLDQPASPDLVEQFSQYFTFQHLLIRRTTRSLSRRTKWLSRYVGEALQEEARREIQGPGGEGSTGIGSMLSEELSGDKVARLRIATLLNLVLTGQQKAILAHLVHHPHLSLPDLLALLHSQSQDERSIQRQLDPLLIELQLVRKDLWEAGVGWRERERYQLSETGLRFLAMRHGLTPAYYLIPEKQVRDEKKRVSPRDASVNWEQRGAALLRRQMGHTNALYQCVRAIIEVGVRSGAYRIICWKSARESLRCYYDPDARDWMNVCPDAELLYVQAHGVQLESILIEYDRGTTFYREYAAKFEAYSSYQRSTRTTLPPMLVVIQRASTARTIREAIDRVGAADVPVMMVLEVNLMKHGLLKALTRF
jgi:Replication-relaxation